jgi:predicted amidophosphoribosyltransferase
MNSDSDIVMNHHICINCGIDWEDSGPLVFFCWVCGEVLA